MESSITQAPRKTWAADLSNRNALLDLIASLRHGAVRKETGLFFVEGARMVGEAVSSGAAIEAMVISPDMCSLKDVMPAQCANLARLVVEVGRRRYVNAAKHFALKQNPQGIGALVRQSWAGIDRLAPPSDCIAVALSSVRDAGNVGTILRTCDAVGCSMVFIMGETADPYGPAAVKASLGAIFACTPVRCDPQSLMRWASRTGTTIIGTSPRAARSYRQVRYERPMVLMLGNEAKGLSDEEMGLCHRVVSIPMAGRCDSLNVAVAGAVILYEAFSQGIAQAKKDSESKTFGGRRVMKCQRTH